MRHPASKFRFRRLVYRRGEVVGVRRYTGSGVTKPVANADVMARVIGYQADELVGGIVQGDRRVIMLVEDLIDKQWPAGVVTTTDKIIIRGKEIAIMSVDDNTHRDGNECIALELQVRG
jgi:hypothetical protein